ncbi:alpha/beta hydrolase [Sphingomonas kyeonggiensis]|uniref:Acetyl esterase/lipase n=1 Tax=Sphingomonas kyeonggiensis TaxID=1268553 RepID=A0A7W6JRL4_9SPHN|nr:alpha/beta hydrolase [Sphingomonas kyeonggiensis]MBB4097201.1 acetyl esterase/lipase [Sphingomonas kyeonggiensis]
MRKVLILLPLLLAGMPALAQSVPPHEIAYGATQLQKLDFHKGVSAGAPLVVFVHGGGWKRGDKGNATGDEKVAHFTGRGFAFASVNYRLVPGVTVEQQAQDVADALGYLVQHARELGFDPGKVVLMGHSAGAHLAALVATDPAYLRKAGWDLERLAGVVLLDGAAYDVPAQMADGPRVMGGTYQAAFGSDPARQRVLSPTLQAGSPNARDFLILHVQREDGARQSEALGRALEAAGAHVTVQGLEGRGLRGHMAINRQLGHPGYPATAVVDRWIDGVLAR